VKRVEITFEFSPYSKIKNEISNKVFFSEKPLFPIPPSEPSI
jgi:hypothetical protein